MSRPVHPPGFDDQHDGPAAALADTGGRLAIGREVDVLPVAADQALRTDRVEKAIDRAVIEQLGRFDGGKSKIDLDAVALVRADERSIEREREPLLVVGGDDFFQLLAADRLPVPRGRGQQFIDRHPALGVERDADRIGIVPEDEAEELADVGELVVHNSNKNPFFTNFRYFASSNR